MNAAKWWNDNTKKWTRRLAMPVIALALAASLTTYEFAKPTAAKAASASPAAAPLDVDSVGALLSLDKAMETLAARVTPAVVNVTVTSRVKAEANNKEDSRRYAAILRRTGWPLRTILRTAHAAAPAADRTRIGQRRRDLA